MCANRDLSRASPCVTPLHKNRLGVHLRILPSSGGCRRTLSGGGWCRCSRGWRPVTPPFPTSVPWAVLRVSRTTCCSKPNRACAPTLTYCERAHVSLHCARVGWERKRISPSSSGIPSRPKVDICVRRAHHATRQRQPFTPQPHWVGENRIFCLGCPLVWTQHL